MLKRLANIFLPPIVKTCQVKILGRDSKMMNVGDKPILSRKKSLGVGSIVARAAAPFAESGRSALNTVIWSLNLAIADALLKYYK